MELQNNIPLKNLTTLAIGGPAKFFTLIKTEGELAEAIDLAQKEGSPYKVIGGGSNLLVSDEGFPGLIIKNNLRGLASQGPALRAHSGTPLQELINFTVKNSLGGMQKLTGIPGTVGGAVYGNAGAYGQTISDHITKVAAYDPEQHKTITLSVNECQFNYRDSIFKRNNFIILEVHFQLPASQGSTLQGEAQETLKLRLAKYPPALKCPGSFFKNVIAENLSPEVLQLIPREKVIFGKIPVGYLLESVGAKEQRTGNIQISPNHGNLFVNLGNGNANDFYQLAKTYAQKVKEKYGITLEPEVQLLNLPPL